MNKIGTEQMARGMNEAGAKQMARGMNEAGAKQTKRDRNEAGKKQAAQDMIYLAACALHNKASEKERLDKIEWKELRRSAGGLAISRKR